MINEKQKNINKLINALEENKETLEAMLEIKLNYYPQSLKKLEEAIQEMYPFGRKVNLEVAAILGAYLGETIIKALKKDHAEWEDFEKNPFDASIRVKTTKVKNKNSERIGDFIIKPMTRMNKFINHDRTDSIFAAYAMTMDFYHGRIDISEKRGQWHETPRNYKYRMVDLTEEEIKKDV